MIGIALLPARGVGEFLINLLRIGLLAAVAYGFVRWLLRDNPLAYVMAAYGVLAAGVAGEFVRQPDAWVRGHGIVGAVLLILPVVVLVVSVRRVRG
jgi:hypothetical protein